MPILWYSYSTNPHESPYNSTQATSQLLIIVDQRTLETYLISTALQHPNHHSASPNFRFGGLFQFAIQMVFG
jgi:hypothetical protein